VRAWLGATAALAVLAVGCGGEAVTPAVPEGRYVAAGRSFVPPVLLFADSAVARVDVVVDRDHIDPDRVRLKAALRPFERVGGMVVERRDFSRYTRLRYELRLRCLAFDCLPEGAASLQGSIGPERVHLFKPALVLYDDPRTGRPRLLKRVWWPRVVTLSRISPSDPHLTQRFALPFRTNLSPLPGLTYRIHPAALAALLLLAAVGLLALPVRTARRWLRSRRPPPPEAEPELTPLERAILLVEWARERVDGQDRRKALEVLAFELDASGRGELAQATRTLAWSPVSPAPDATGALIESVKESDGA
jgi:hypothetical protein